MDLNLLAVLDVLLQEQSVTRAAERLGSSPAAVSRKLATLRRITGDGLLVRAGQQMVPTPRALELQAEVRALIERTESVLAPAGALRAADLARTFTIQVGELLQISLGAPLLARLRSQAPGVRVVFLPETLEDTPALRQGVVDLELGVLAHLDPEIRSARLATVPILAAARSGHPLFDGPIDARRFAEADHISISRTGKPRGPLDAALADQGLSRNVTAVVPDHFSAMMLARTTDLVCLTIAAAATDTMAELGLRTFPIPLDVPPVVIGMAWHPRHHTDSAHRWFRTQVRATVTEHIARHTAT
ncbi:LysR family transcriptional regulator [Sphaerisporangium sp. NPDC051011]|uniref:LysR family transcriptional regulator n=1 Tax=Sphaerisporangium sp. NPDC051011 TaxID=3155792 RepID=UPI0033CF0778